MLAWIAFLILLPVGGEALMQALGLPIPGSVAGFVALLAWLCRRGKAAPPALGDASSEFVRRLPLFLIPPSVGMLVHLDLLGKDWLAILAAVTVGTGTTIAVTGLVTETCLRAADQSERHRTDLAAPHPATEPLTGEPGR